MGTIQGVVSFKATDLTDAGTINFEGGKYLVIFNPWHTHQGYSSYSVCVSVCVCVCVQGFI